MYLVKIKNNNEEIVIHANSTEQEAPRIKGTIKQGINTIDSLNFEVMTNNPGYTKISPLTTKIEVINELKNKVDFSGRVLLSTEVMNSTGNLVKSIVCESELGYLMDSIQTYGEYHNISVRNFLNVIIQNHNLNVEEYKRFEVGIVTVEDSNDSLYRFLSYSKTLQAIKEKLVDRLGGELRIRLDNGIRYLDYLKSEEESPKAEIRLSKNLQYVEEEKDPTSVITRLIPLGAKLEDSEERITVSSVNNGINYIDDTEAIKEFGIIVNTETWDDVNTSSILFSKAKSFLTANNKIKKKYKVTALDLSLIGLDIESFNVKDYYLLINEIMDLNESLRVIEKTIDINNPQNSSLSIGDKFENIKDYQLGISKVRKSLKVTSETLNTTITSVNNLSTEVTEATNVIGETNIVLNSTNENLLALSEIVSAINDKVNINIQKTTELEQSATTIISNLNNINKKLNKLTRRMNMEV